MIDPINKSITIECFIATTPYLRAQALFSSDGIKMDFSV